MTIKIPGPDADHAEARPAEEAAGPRPAGEDTLPLPRRKPMTEEEVSPRTREILASRFETLSTLPTVMTNLVAALQDPETPPRDVTRLASTDPAVAAEILRTVNSSYYALRETVKDLGHAILMLGYNQVKFLVMRLGVDTSIGAAQQSEYRVKLASIWRHSHLASEAVALLVRHHGGGAGMEASTAALLHDIGKLLILDLPAREDLDVDTVFRTEVLPVEERIFVEEDFYGVNHCLVGDRIAERLKLPPLVRLVISLHHHPLDSPEIADLPRETVRMLALVKLSDALAHGFAARLGSEAGSAAVPGVGDREMALYRRHLRDLPEYPRLLEEVHQPLRKAAAFLDSLMPAHRAVEAADTLSSPSGRPRPASPAGRPPASAGGGASAPAGHVVANRYLLLKKLGEGSAGAVHLCEDTLLGQRFAIKILRPLLQQSTPALDAFVNEARVAMRLNHPNIIRVFHLDVREGTCFILQEYVEGWTLDQVVKKSPANRLPEGHVARIAMPLAQAIAYAHDNGVVHRDLSPRNVIIGQRGEVKLLDFGVAALKDLEGGSRVPASGEVVGTPYYMSPEHWEGNGKVDRRSDVYSFGALIYVLLSGSAPFPCESWEDLRRLQLTTRPKPLSWVSPQWMRIVDRCLEPDPSLRWQDFRAVVAELEAVGAAPSGPAGLAPSKAGDPRNPPTLGLHEPEPAVLECAHQAPKS